MIGEDQHRAFTGALAGLREAIARRVVLAQQAERIRLQPQQAAHRGLQPARIDGEVDDAVEAVRRQPVAGLGAPPADGEERRAVSQHDGMKVETIFVDQAEIAQVAREMGALTVGVVTKPFRFEGRRRSRMADLGIEALERSADITGGGQINLANLTDGQGKHLVRSCFDDGTWVHELVKTVQAPVQLVSAFGYIYVFRQAFTNRQILVSRFVLGGRLSATLPQRDLTVGFGKAIEVEGDGVDLDLDLGQFRLDARRIVVAHPHA